VNETRPGVPNAEPQYSARGFWALIITQFQGAFSDNALKWLTIFLITQLNLPDGQRDRLVSVVATLFAVPFILFSMAGGYLADRFSKRRVVLGVKGFEIFVMSLALVSLAAHYLYLTIGCVFLMGVHSAIFGPSKYGLLPELLPEKKLSWGNGILEFGTFIAIIGGTVAGGWVCKAFAAQPGWAGVIFIVLAFVGLVTGLGITKVPAAGPDKQFNPDFITDLWAQVKLMRRDRPLWLAMIGNTYFFAIAALIQMVIVIYAKDVMGINDPAETSYLQAATAIGIGLGCFLAGFLSAGKIETGLIPFGAVGLTVCAVFLGRRGLSFGAVATNLSLLGFFGGFYIVPISAMLQHRPAREQKGGVLAAANLISFIGIALASVVFGLLTAVLKLSPPEIFLVIAGLTLVATVYLLLLMPDALLRFVLWCATHSFYRIRVVGRDHIPAKGGALFVCNHVSWVDALLLIASTDRPVRFLMFKDIYERKWIHWGAKILGVIPVSSEQRPRELIQSLQAASDAIRAGEVVCIFAEGEITRIGQLLPFRRGYERIMKNVDAPIIPVALDGVLGSPGSFRGGKFVLRLPARIPHPVTVSFGRPLPATAAPFEVRTVVQELLADGWKHRRGRMLPLQRAFVRTCRRHPRRFAMADAQNRHVTFSTALLRTVFLARRLKSVWAGQEMVGLLLPPSVAGALVNHAALLCGKVPVNLNYTLSADGLASCVKQCGIQTVITSRLFQEKLKLTVPGKVLYLEDLAKNPGLLEKIGVWMMARFWPISLLERSLYDASVSGSAPAPGAAGGALAAGNTIRQTEAGLSAARRGEPQPGRLRSSERLDSLATIIFSSGSTGEPKGVMLSHFNIGSNVEQLGQVFALDGHDRILGILPFFHSFGFTGTLALPALLGAGVVFHPNPLDSRAIGPLVRDNAVTFLLATPTFLQLYLRGCAPGDFGSLRLVMTGAEKLPDRLAAAFEEHFGIRPLEGYGTTECSPAVAVNGPDFRAAGVHQVGGKRGKIGHPLPGVSVKIVDPENPRGGRVLPLGESGMLLVRGPNVMQGYLDQPAKSAEVLVDDVAGESGVSAKWYITGDIAALDEDGFLQITGRLNRFSKIGGEMVPHLNVEEKLHELAGATEQTFVVTAVPDDKKGERLVVLHKLADAALAACLEKLGACDLPNLWKPKADAFYRVEHFPLLGTGKLDLRKVKELARTLATTNGHK
jgi:acyl-[acyl-carrier-protein]-phospholipid O-acyltransferase / long-chain-fatty-acid--[acyl-carrier-protein] ligase